MKFYAKGISDEVNKSVIGTMSVYQHCVDVGLVTRVLLSDVYFNEITKLLSKQLGTSESVVIDMCSLYASFHDIGKIHVAFQMNFENAVQEMLSEGIIEQGYCKRYGVDKFNYYVRHEVITRKILRAEFDSIYRKTEAKNLFKGLLYVLSSHHEKDNNKDERLAKGVSEEGNAIIFDAQRGLLSDLRSIFKFDFSALLNMKYDNVDSVCMTFFGILVLSDWISSSFYMMNKVELFDSCVSNGCINKYIRVREKQIKSILKDNLGFLSDSVINISSFDAIFGTSEYSLRSVQGEIKNVCVNKDKKFVLIEAPMGEGKTEAGLYAAGNMAFDKKGFFMALPTGATTQMMYDRLTSVFDNQGITDLNVLYSNAFMVEKLYSKGMDDKYNLFSKSRTGLFIANGVGTVDQAMMGVLKSNFAVLRLLGLINKVLVIDEVHAYDSYMGGILSVLLRWCNKLEIPVVLLSATLPKKLRQKYVNDYLGYSVNLTCDSYPLITTIDVNDKVSEVSVGSSFMKKEVNFVPLKIDEEDYSTFYNKVKLETTMKKNIGIICNTIKESQKLYKELSNFLSDYDIVLLHSNFKVKDRAKKEDYIKSRLGKNGIATRQKPLLVIGTQVLEQSLDIDFDCMFSYLCPIDLLLQRIGRWRRFNIGDREYSNIVYVIVPKSSFNYLLSVFDKVYDGYIMKKTEELVLANKIYKLPEDFRYLISYVYDAVDFSDGACVKRLFEEDTKEKLGLRNAISYPNSTSFSRTDFSEVLFDDSDVEFETYSTRLTQAKRKVVLLSENRCSELGISDSEYAVLDKELAKELLENSCSVYSYMCGSVDLNKAKLVELKGMLKGYLLLKTDKSNLSEVVDIEVEDEKGRKSIYSYSYFDDEGLCVLKN